MAPNIDDRWIWLGFGIFVFIAAQGIRHAIQDIITLTEIEPDLNDSKGRNTEDEQPEDSISLENLKILAESPHTNIANSAISLIVSRYAKIPNAYQSIVRDLSSKNERTREQARQTIDCLLEWPVPPELDPIRTGRRRRSSFSPLPELIDGDTRLPPGSPIDDLASDFEVDDVWETDEEIMARIQATAERYGVSHDEALLLPTPENPIAGWTNIPRERPSAGVEGEAEAEQRRRRREAMVFHEGEGGVNEEDIIRPRRRQRRNGIDFRVP